jgi:hypothetical protein
MPNAVKTQVYDPKAERLLFDALKGRARGRTELVKVTRADAVALTGMPADQAEPALKSLVKSYRSHLAVTEEGELVYEFDPSLERRDKVPLAERLRAAGQVAWRGFQFLFKIWIVVTLIAYVVAFLAMMLALLFARSNDRDDRRGGDGGGGLFWLWWWMMPDLAPAHDPYGRPVRRKLTTADGKPRKRFYLSVFDFVFGPKGQPLDPREQDKRLIAFLRDHKGRVTAAEMAALTGLSLERADEELTRLTVEYDGEVDVADDGTLLYKFDSLRTSALGSESTGNWWTWFWDRHDKQPPLTGNSSGTDVAIGAFAGFNLLASMTIGPAFLQRIHLAQDPAALFFVSTFPLIFSMLFFAVPAGRWLKATRRAKKLQRNQVRKELLREIWNRSGEALDPAALSKQVAERAQQPLELAKAQLEKLLSELDGDVTTDAEGRMRYTFPRLVQEKKAIADARAAAPERTLGRVEFSSEEPGTA